jgi:predicted dehydrogenase
MAPDKPNMMADGGAGLRRLGLVGFGALAERYYVPALCRRRDVVVVCVVDPLPQRRAAASRCFPRAKTCAVPQDLLAGGELDAILVAAPPAAHLDIWNRASRQGLPVFMEKPFVLAGELARVESAAPAQGLLMVNFNRRFWPAYQRMGELALAGVIGELRTAEFVFQTNALNWGAVTDHRLLPREGGALYDLGSHALDLIPHLLQDEPLTINATARSVRWEQDQIELHIEMRSGLRFGCRIGYHASGRESLVIQGSRGSLHLDNPNKALHLRPQGAAVNRLGERLRDGARIAYRALWRSRSLLRFSMEASLGAFLDTLSAGGTFSPGFADATQNAGWLEAAQQSIVQKRTVSLALHGQGTY